MKPEPVDDSHRLSTRMVGCVVPKEYCVLLPAWLFIVQGTDQLVKEYGDHVTVGVGVRQTEPDLALGVESSNQ